MTRRPFLCPRSDSTEASRIVYVAVPVTGDADLVPAMKPARREGLRVYLDTKGGDPVRPSLTKHADCVLGVG